MKFGIELECGLIEHKADNIKDFCEDIGWEFKDDNSLRRNCNSNEEIVLKEIATKPFELEELKHVELGFKKVYSAIGDINDSMGLHIHMSTELGDMNALYTKRFVKFFKAELKRQFAGNELLLKRLKNHYCSERYKNGYFLKSSPPDRYNMVNYSAYGRHQTIEFRIFNAPSSEKEIIAYLLFTYATIVKYLSVFNYKIKGEILKDEISNEQLNENEQIEEIVTYSI